MTECWSNIMCAPYNQRSSILIFTAIDALAILSSIFSHFLHMIKWEGNKCFTSHCRSKKKTTKNNEKWDVENEMKEKQQHRIRTKQRTTGGYGSTSEWVCACVCMLVWVWVRVWMCVSVSSFSYYFWHPSSEWVVSKATVQQHTSPDKFIHKFHMKDESGCMRVDRIALRLGCLWKMREYYLKRTKQNKKERRNNGNSKPNECNGKWSEFQLKSLVAICHLQYWKMRKMRGKSLWLQRKKATYEHEFVLVNKNKNQLG